MPRIRKEVDEGFKFPPAESQEARENQLINMASDLAATQLLNGTASSQVITHFLKLGTVKASLENEKLIRENELLKAKVETLQSQQRSEELYQQALDAMRTYAGMGNIEVDIEDEVD